MTAGMITVETAADAEALARLGNMLGALEDEAPKVINRALNRVGDMGRTRVVRELARDTGLPLKLIRRSVKTKRSGWRDLRYELLSVGGDVSLKHFRKRETKAGVVANLGALRGRVLFPRTFFRGGKFPRRVDIHMGGHVFDRMSEQRYHLKRVSSGVFIPQDMAEGAAAKAFDAVVASHLEPRLEHEIAREMARLLGVANAQQEG